MQGNKITNRGGRRKDDILDTAGQQKPRVKGIKTQLGPTEDPFEFSDRGMLMPLGDHMAHWSNLLGEIVREFPMALPFCKDIDEGKTGDIRNIRSQFFVILLYGELRDSRVPCPRSRPTSIHILLTVYSYGFEERFYIEDARPQRIRTQHTPTGRALLADEFMGHRSPGQASGHILVRMTKVIKREFKKIKDVKVEYVSLTCDTPLEVFNNEVNRLSGMDDDLFTYEFDVANIPCDLKMDDESEHEADDDMGYDPSDIAFTEWLGSKFFNYKTMDHYTMKALWITADYEWYEALEDSKLKDEALINKAIMEGFIKEDDDESRYEQERRWNIYTNYDDAYEINHGNNEKEELCEVHELPAVQYKEIYDVHLSFI
ncbi:hypothetical protein Tco_0486447 [Tanacetum coccineum]